jgi:hypothetical protein
LSEISDIFFFLNYYYFFIFYFSHMFFHKHKNLQDISKYTFKLNNEKLHFSIIKKNIRNRKKKFKFKRLIFNIFYLIFIF